MVSKLATSLWLLFITFAAGCVATGPQSPVRHYGVSDSNITGPTEHGSVSFERWQSCAKLARPIDVNSGVAIQEIITKPENIEQLLRNVKLAWDRELLLQPSFFDDVTLHKFFNASAVQAETPSTFFGLEYVSANLAAQVESDVSPKMTVRIESSCIIFITHDAYGHPSRDAEFTGIVKLNVGSTSKVTLRLVREIFGHEDTNNPDLGVDQHGTTYTPTIKGSVIYFNQPRIEHEGSVVDVAFYFRLDPPDKQDLVGGILDEDVLEQVTINDTTHRMW